MNHHVLAAMSGGVDSSVAAYLLLEAGFTVTGATMKLYRPDTPAQVSLTCGADRDVEDARAVCRRLGIPHKVYDLGDLFQKTVIRDFIDEYEAGRTPNPCVVCNRCLKFGALSDAARDEGADFVATGHYARIVQNGSRRYLLKKAADPGKDQSYVLWQLSQTQLSHILLPLGDRCKTDIRAMAEDLGFVTAHKSDSQDICFVPDGEYARFIADYTGHAPIPGNFVNEDGRVLGRHRGIIHYTVGQRKGLGLSLGMPMFVKSKDAATGQVVLSTDEKLYGRIVSLSHLNLIAADRLDRPIRCEAKLRYRHPAAPATLTQTGPDTARLTFDEPQRAAAAGQSAVFYDGDTVIGGGIIEGSEEG